MIFTKVEDVTLEKIEDANDEPSRENNNKPFIRQKFLDSSYYAHLSTGEVIKCHNRATAEFYLRNESYKR